MIVVFLAIALAFPVLGCLPLLTVMALWSPVPREGVVLGSSRRDLSGDEISGGLFSSSDN